MMKGSKKKGGGDENTKPGPLVGGFFYFYFYFILLSYVLFFHIIVLTLGYSVARSILFSFFLFFFCELEKANYFSSSLLLLTHGKIPCRLVAHVAFLGFVR